MTFGRKEGALVLDGIARDGEELRKRYDIGDKLGRGSFGTVYACVQRSTGRKYALKVISKALIHAHNVSGDIRRGAMACQVALRSYNWLRSLTP